MVKIYAIGGYSQFGRNMTALIYKKTILILDCGLKLQRIKNKTQRILPDFKSFFKSMDKTLKDYVIQGLILSHGHLDHSGAIKDLLKLHNIPIFCSKFSGELIKRLGYSDNYTNLDQNKLTIKDFTISSIKIQHSIPQTLLVKIQVDKKSVIYASDFKIDYTPEIGEPTNLKVISEFCNTPDLLIVDTTRANSEIQERTKSEAYVTGSLQDLFGFYSRHGRNIFISSFASNISRISTISRLSKKYNFNFLVIGSAFKPYILSANSCGLLPKMNLKKLAIPAIANLDYSQRYVFLVTGCQGQKDSFLYKLSKNKLNYKKVEQDVIIFSSTPIPEKINNFTKKRINKYFKII
jgi:ribonuclease J